MGDFLFGQNFLWINQLRNSLTEVFYFYNLIKARSYGLDV